MVPAGSLRICYREDWSDHSFLALRLRLPKLDLHVPPPILARQVRAPVQQILTECDLLALETVASAISPEKATTALYGHVCDMPGPHTRVHLVSTCRNAGRIDARSSFGAFRGVGGRHNCGLRIPGAQNDGRAVLMGIIYVLITIPIGHAVAVFTASKHAIRSICYWAGSNYMRGWACANGDLLEIIAQIIKGRKAAITFTWLTPADTSKDAYLAAHKLATEAIS
ncbi:hypothetical protein C8J57DRAFT_1597974, partial [Mycena rebaudengoi]